LQQLTKDPKKIAQQISEGGRLLINIQLADFAGCDTGVAPARRWLYWH
jgi:hypothetical protein